MSEKPLLLSSARSGVLIQPATTSWRRLAIVATGLFVILVGAADVTARLASGALGERASTVAFGPVAAIGNPSPFGLFSGSGATTTVFDPARIVIEVAGVDAPIEPVGKKDNGAMDTPKKLADVGWYTLGSKPGEAGNAVFAGHVNNALGLDGVFAHLSDVVVGDLINVADDSGRMLTYVARAIDLYPVEAAPAENIFAIKGPSQVVLITCEGVWDQDTHSYSKRLVVTARLVE